MSNAASISVTTDRERAIATVVAAFLTDPVTRWVYPDARQYITGFPRIVEAFGGRAFDNGSAHSAPELQAVALWLPPGVEPDGDAMGQIMGETVSELLLEHLFGFSEKQSSLHPHEPHWYLPLIGVDPFHQGRGLGSALLSHATAIADAARLPAYLEATNLNNRRLYERHGFEVVGEIQYGSSPMMYGMHREPQKTG
jgi:ribosomal protein S18 acetylase RimI-like enzyme